MKCSSIPYLNSYILHCLQLTTPYFLKILVLQESWTPNLFSYSTTLLVLILSHFCYPHSLYALLQSHGFKSYGIVMTSQCTSPAPSLCSRQETNFLHGISAHCLIRIWSSTWGKQNSCFPTLINCWLPYHFGYWHHYLLNCSSPNLGILHSLFSSCHSHFQSIKPSTTLQLFLGVGPFLITHYCHLSSCICARCMWGL